MEATYYVVLVYPSGESVRLNTIPTRGQAAQQAASWFRSRVDDKGELPVSVRIAANQDGAHTGTPLANG